MANGIRAEGLDKFTTDLLKTLSKYPKVAEKFLKDEGNELRKRVRAKAKEKIGKKTGNYMKGFDKTKPKVTKKVCLIKVFNKAQHSHLIEYGTVKRSTEKGANRGFMKGAFILDETAREFEEQFSEDVENKLVDELLDKGAF